MTKRCRHELETKADYPNDRICRKCQTIWTVTDYMDWTAKQLMTLPNEIRFEVLSRQAEKFAEGFLKENPDYYDGLSQEK
jgi:hypothetical protein